VRYGLAIGGYCAPFVLVVMYLLGMLAIRCRGRPHLIQLREQRLLRGRLPSCWTGLWDQKKATRELPFKIYHPVSDSFSIPSQLQESRTQNVPPIPPRRRRTSPRRRNHNLKRCPIPQRPKGIGNYDPHQGCALPTLGPCPGSRGVGPYFVEWVQ
jgi:hypothetical protein